MKETLVYSMIKTLCNNHLQHLVCSQKSYNLFLIIRYTDMDDAGDSIVCHS